MRTTWTAAAATALALMCAGTAGAAEYTPTIFDDPVPGSDNAAHCPPDAVAAGCTIDDALLAARSHPGDDVIRLLPGTYNLVRSIGIHDPDKVTIAGAGARATTLQAHGTEHDPARGIVVDDGNRADVSDLSITGTYSSGDGNIDGAALFVDDGASALVSSVHIHGNTTLGSGGAISNRGTLTVDSSLIDGNSAQESGGAIDSLGALKVVNTTISGNKVDSGFNPGESVGGAINAASFGRDGSLTVERSTITGNETASDGSGIAVGGDVVASVKGSIVSGNSDGKNCLGTIASGGHNIEDGTSCGFELNAAPQLGALADNGGPTNTFAIAAGSPALDQGGDCPATDQRGYARNSGPCDVGAFEFGGEPPKQGPVPVDDAPTTGTPPASGGGSGTTPPPPIKTPASCNDKDKPFTTLKSAGVKHSGKAVTLRGKSRDAKGKCPSGLARVQVSLAKVSGTELNCKFLRAPNRFVLTPFRNCRKPILFAAKGTSRWSFKFPVHLAPGKYRAQARGYDKAGNKETPTKGRNIVYFTVR